MGESSFWYRPTRVVPDQGPLNGRCRWSLLLSKIADFSSLLSFIGTVKLADFSSFLPDMLRYAIVFADVRVCVCMDGC